MESYWPKIMISPLCAFLLVLSPTVSVAVEPLEQVNVVKGVGSIPAECKVVVLKDHNRKSAVSEKFEGQTLILTLYDINAKGEYIKSDQICIPSWYGMARVEYKDLLGDGKHFIFVEFEGNTGLGTLQIILLVIGWHEDRFVPVLLETVFYKLEELFDSTTRLYMDYVIRNVGTSNVAIDVEYKYFAIDDKLPFKFEAKWSERLVWSNQSYSFYSEVPERIKVLNQEKNKFWNVPFAVIENIVKVRSRVKEFDVNDLCGDFLEKSAIMSIMNGPSEGR
jgi:hypothetical protein